MATAGGQRQRCLGSPRPGGRHSQDPASQSRGHCPLTAPRVLIVDALVLAASGCPRAAGSVVEGELQAPVLSSLVGRSAPPRAECNWASFGRSVCVCVSFTAGSQVGWRSARILFWGGCLVGTFAPLAPLSELRPPHLCADACSAAVAVGQRIARWGLDKRRAHRGFMARPALASGAVAPRCPHLRVRDRGARLAKPHSLSATFGSGRFCNSARRLFPSQLTCIDFDTTKVLLRALRPGVLEAGVSS